MNTNKGFISAFIVTSMLMIAMPRVLAIDSFLMESSGERCFYFETVTLPDTIDEQHGDFFTMVDEMPSFPDGIEKMGDYLAENFHYPAHTKDIPEIEGLIIINFIVEADGSLSNVKLIKLIEDYGLGLNEEAVRVVSSMPKWIPGKQNGKNVRVSYNLPLKIMF